MRFYIFYSGGRLFSGRSAVDWRLAPDDGVLHVIRPRHLALHERRWKGVEDRDLWTGESYYDPFGWGVKRGVLVTDEEYFKTFDLAAYGQYRS